jgi:hypothetical protein
MDPSVYGSCECYKTTKADYINDLMLETTTDCGSYRAVPLLTLLLQQMFCHIVRLIGGAIQFV